MCFVCVFLLLCVSCFSLSLHPFDLCVSCVWVLFDFKKCVNKHVDRRQVGAKNPNRRRELSTERRRFFRELGVLGGDIWDMQISS